MPKPALPKTTSFKCLLSIFFSSKMFKSNAHIEVGKIGVEVKANGLVAGREGFLVALEVIKSVALIVVGSSVVGVKLDGLVAGHEVFLK